MVSHRSSATAVGILFVVATGCYIIGQSVYAPITGSAEVLDVAYGRRGWVIVGVLVELVGILAIPLIALLFYPVLRVYDERGALAYGGIRIVEAVGLLLPATVAWALVEMSQLHGLSDPATASWWVVVGEGFQAVSGASFLISVAFVFPLGALLLNGMLWRFRLVPRAISGWGLAGAGVLLVGSILDVFEMLPPVSPILIEGVLAGPIAVQEMALAGWLIVKGINEGSPS